MISTCFIELSSSFNNTELKNSISLWEVTQPQKHERLNCNATTQITNWILTWNLEWNKNKRAKQTRAYIRSRHVADYVSKFSEIAIKLRSLFTTANQRQASERLPNIKFN